VRWAEVEDDGLRPDAWGLRSVLDRLERDGDPWADIARAAGGLPRLG
jgi:DNA primase